MRARCLALLAVLAAASGCTFPWESRGPLYVEDDSRSPFELLVRYENGGGADVTLDPHDLRLVATSGATFLGTLSGHDGALRNGTLVPVGTTGGGWVKFLVDDRAVAPLTLVLETDGVREETAVRGGV